MVMVRENRAYQFKDSMAKTRAMAIFVFITGMLAKKSQVIITITPWHSTSAQKQKQFAFAEETKTRLNKLKRSAILLM